MMKAIFFLIMSCAFAARADILFLDINNASSEYKAAVEAAKKRNPPEKVHRIPETTPEQSKLQQDAENVVEKITGQLQKTCPAGTFNENCTQLQGQLDQANAALREATKPSAQQLADFKKQLRALNDQGVKLTSVVISGHDGNGKFSGVYGALSADQLSSAFEDTPGLVKDVRSVLLWGCYTTAPSSVDAQWKPVFPNVGVFAGFDRRAPSKLRDESGDYLKDFLMVDQELINARDENERRAAIEKIHAFNKGSGVEASICLGQFVITPAGEKTREQIARECAVTPQVKKALQVYQCYEQAVAPECQNPPTDTETHRGPTARDKCPRDVAHANSDFFTRDGVEEIFPACQNPLRSVYEFIQARGDCAPYWDDLIPEGLTIPDLQKVQSLLFYNNIRTNLSSLHRDDLAQIDANLRELGMPGSMIVSDIGNLSRADMMKRLAAIQAALDSRPHGGKVDAFSVKLQLAKQQIKEIGEILSTMNKTPPTWHGNTAEMAQALRASVSPQAVDDTYKQYYSLELKQRYAGHSESLTKPLVQDAQAKFEETKKAYSEGKNGPNAKSLLEAKKSAQIALAKAKDAAGSSVGSDLLSVVQADFAQRKAAGMDSYEEKAYLQYIESLKRKAAKN